MSSYLYTIVINKYNSSDQLDVFHIIAKNLLEAVEIANMYTYEKDRYKNTPVEIAGIVRETFVRDILNIEEKASIIQNDPFDLENVTDDDVVIEFKHTCSNVISVLDNGWEEVECPDCHKKIHRNEIENVGGLWLYVGTDKDGKI